MDNLKTSVSIKKVEFVMKNLPIKLLHFRELPWWNLPKKKWYKHFQKIKEEGTLPNLFLEASVTCRRQWHPTPVLLPGKSHGQRSLVGCSPWGRWGLDMTERFHFHFSLSCIGEGNGNPLQCSCLENPRDGGARWAAVYGVAQSQTRLKRLSSSSSSVTPIPIQTEAWQNEK